MKLKKNKVFSALAAICATVALPAWGAELLDVKPIVNADVVTVEVTADIPMTYTYYKIPGEARAIVDIADADPEKVEPLIVVNKGAISSISVDKALISNITVSRLVFNLVAEGEISVTASADRKKLTVSVGSNSATSSPAKNETADVTPTPIEPPLKKSETIESKVPDSTQSPTPNLEEKHEAPPGATASPKDDDPLGLDEPIAPPPSTPPKAEAIPPAKTVIPLLSTTPPAKLSPVVPATSSPVTLQGIMVGDKTIEIQTTALPSYKTMKLDNPPRLVIDIQGVKSLKGNSFAVGKFGVEKVRVGNQGNYVRVVIDSRSAKLPESTISVSDKGVKIIFK